MSPIAPALPAGEREPMAWAASSTTKRPNREAVRMMEAMSAVWPKRWTGITPRMVAPSAVTGDFRVFCEARHEVLEAAGIHVEGGRIDVDKDDRRAGPRDGAGRRKKGVGGSDHGVAGPQPICIMARSIASLPEATPIPYRAPVYAAISASRASTSGPRMKYWDEITPSTALLISSFIVAYCAFRSRSGNFHCCFFLSFLVADRVVLLPVLP